MAMYRNDSLLQAGEKVTDEQLATEMKLLVNQRAINRLSRRNFLASAGIGVGAAGALVIAGCGSNSSTTRVTTAPVTTTAPAVTEVDVLNFALNLEYLEASFYLYLTTGNGLSTADMGSTPGTVTGGARFAKARFASSASRRTLPPPPSTHSISPSPVRQVLSSIRTRTV